MNYKKTLIPASISLFFLIIILLSLKLSAYQLTKDAVLTADILINKISQITRTAKNTTEITATMSGQRCKDLLKTILKTVALTPYVRSTGLIQKDFFFCSSITEDRVISVPKLYLPLISDKKNVLKISAIRGTAFVPGEIAILYTYSIDNKMTSFSVVDARYFIDLIDSLNEDNHALFQLQFNNGIVVSGQEKISPRDIAFMTALYSDFNQVKIEIVIPKTALYSYFFYNFFLLGPILLLLILVVVYLLRVKHSTNNEMIGEIKRGMANGEFFVHYQPICDTSSGKCTGAEALMRWQRKDGRIIPPMEFINVAEKEGIIISLTKHLFGLIEADITKWHVTSPFHLSVNISAVHLDDVCFTKDVLGLRKSLDTSINLVLEITERSFIEDTSIAHEKLAGLRMEGCLVAIDDFGTGYCSLNLLQNLPIDYLKIDRTFISSLNMTSDESPILEMIVSLSKRLGLIPIAEGVTTLHQVEWLKNNHVDYVQGYLYGKPMTSRCFFHWYVETNSRPLN